MRVLGRRCPYLSFCLLLVWQVLEDLAIDRMVVRIPSRHPRMRDNHLKNPCLHALGSASSGYRRALFEVVSIANLWVLSRMWSVFSLLYVFLVVPRNYHLSTLWSGFQGIYTPLQWSFEDVSSQIEVKFEEKIQNWAFLLRENPREVPYTCMCRVMGFMVYIGIVLDAVVSPILWACIPVILK